MRAPGSWSRRKALATAGGALVLAACGTPRRQPGPGTSLPAVSAVPSLPAVSTGPSLPAVSSVSTVPSVPRTPTADTVAAAVRPDFLYLAILPGAVVGRPDWPLFVPGNFTVPSNALVQAEIRCFDDRVAPVGSGFERVVGTADHRITVIPALTGDLNAVTGQRVASLAPGNIAHTLTVSGLGLNIPIPPRSTVRFAFRTAGPGTYTWQSMAGRGTGAGGRPGPMAPAGWMRGTLTVQV